MSAITSKYAHREWTSPLKTNVTLSHIFSYLEGRELARFSKVCREWNKHLKQPELWQALLSKHFNFSGPLDPNLLKPAFRYSFLFYFIDAMQSHQQVFSQSGDWRAIGETNKSFSKITMKNTKENLVHEFYFNEPLTECQIERDHLFAKCPNKIYFLNFKNPSFSSREVTSYFEVSFQKRFEVENGFILLTHERRDESICELIPWGMQNPPHSVISAKPHFFTSADCLQVDNGWLYAFKDKKYLAWSLQKSLVQSEKDAVSFENIPFGHNGKFNFTFYVHGINYRNLLFRVWNDGPHHHVIVRDLNLNDQVVKTFANCQTQDGTFNTTLFESLLRLCLINDEMTNKPSDRPLSKNSYDCN